MDTKKRTELRLKQDFLLMLAAMRKTPETFRVYEHPGAPTLAQIRAAIYPDWEVSMDYQIRVLAQELNVGVPNFSFLAIR